MNTMRTTGTGILYLFLSLLIFGCQNDPAADIDPNAAMLELLSPAATGISFSNDINETAQFNHYVWEYVYNGGGVSVGDVNKDGKPDIFFTGNTVGDKLYLNKGNFKFEDITTNAGLISENTWSCGSTMVDINGDGFLDIYVCRSGPSMEETVRANKLYVNNGDDTFREEAAKYGLDNGGVSMQATFFDYDKDGDLDMYLVNQPLSKRYIPRYNQQPEPNNPLYSDRLFRRDGDKYTDVSAEAGIANYAYGLNAVAADVNDDGWVDIFVSNDYEEPDFLYINQGDGTFSNQNKEQFKHVSFYGMGSDVGDINNDGLYDIGVVDMAAADHYRSKTNMGSMNIDQFWSYVNSGRHYQYMFNTLQLNNGNNTFSEIGQMAGISKTDWSWSLLLADVDNDGWRDVLITNGIKKDIRNNDVGEFLKKQIREGNKNFDPLKLVEAIPSVPLSNYVYHNDGDLHFEDVTAAWGFNNPGFSNGMAYADLDGDGDLDLVINNINEAASIYKNEKGRLNNYLRVAFVGKTPADMGLNAKVKIKMGNTEQVQQLTLTRGYLSSVEPVLHFGLGEAEQIDELTVQWLDGSQQVLKKVAANQTLTLRHVDAGEKANSESGTVAALLRAVPAAFRHQENEFNDFAREILIPHKESQNGPYLAVGDVNGDELEDFFIGGAAGQSGQLYLNTGDNQFKTADSQPWSADRAREDMGALLFDADGDGALDLYVVSGGAEFPVGAAYQDRLYRNDGKGNFVKQTNALPKITHSGQRVVAADFDGDQDLDLFVGGRILPGKYPTAPDSYLLRNEGGRFTDVTDEIAPGLRNIGLVTDALFTDYDNDQDLDLMLVGEWMPVTVFNNDQGQFTNGTTKALLDEYKGWWWSLAAGDFDQDGDTDYVVGNLGRNHKFKADEGHPFVVYGNDFDQNGTNDIVLAKYSGDQLLPVRGRECTSEQMPFVAEKFPTFDGFARATVDKIYTPEQLSNAVKYEVTTFHSLLLKNNGAGQFTHIDLPMAAQKAPLRGLQVADINGDGNPDVLGVGNLYQAEVETVRYDAGTGLVLLGDGKGSFRVPSIGESGFFAAKDARDVAIIRNPALLILVANNNDEMEMFRLK